MEARVGRFWGRASGGASVFDPESKTSEAADLGEVVFVFRECEQRKEKGGGGKKRICKPTLAPINHLLPTAETKRKFRSLKTEEQNEFVNRRSNF